MSREIEASVLPSLLTYHHEDGFLLWKERPPELFYTNGHHRVEVRAAIWNTKFAGKRAFTKLDRRGYYRGAIFNRTYLAHRVAWAIHYGYWPSELDHINGNPGDYRISNLRECSHKQNTRNIKRRYGTSKYAGVSWCRDYDKWRAAINPDKRQFFLGRFDSEIEAAHAYDAAAIKHYGEFARLNFPQQGAEA